MPTFIDHHGMPELSPEMKDGIADRIRAGRPDENGVTGKHVYLAADQAYCVSDAPDADAVVAAHAANGIPLRREDVVELTAVI